MLKIEKQGSRFLIEPSRLVEEEFFDTFDAKLLVDQMFNLMSKHVRIGLAAPQVAHNIRMFIMGDKQRPYVCINPSVLEWSEDTAVDDEGCLSFPGIYLPIRRSASVKVAYYDLSGRLTETNLNGIMARCFQHELDHLNGILFTTHVSKLKLNIARSKAKKYMKNKSR